MSVINIDEIEQNTLAELKDFQLATVSRIDYLYRNGQKRILVADEVGMGKTLIARGAIAKVARIKLEEKSKIFKVAYVCSNQNIANQNLVKLDINNSFKKEDTKDNRLSMQHLRIIEQENDRRIVNAFIQLIPLTPDTSFKISSGTGKVEERALMYTILSRMPFMYTYRDELSLLLQGNVSNTYWWNSRKDHFDERVRTAQNLSQGEYPKNIIKLIDEYDLEYNIKKHLKNVLLNIRNKTYDRSKGNKVISELRTMFARISVSMLKPDLVIMDEFQRFRSLLTSESESDMDILAHSFLDGEDVRVLLLSATPYKLYSTLEEIDDNEQSDEHYEEFLEVMDFLFRGKEDEFRSVWNNYSTTLKELQQGNTTFLFAKKSAEDAMYNGVCRTERISVMEAGDYTDTEKVKSISINEKDIESYIQMGKLLLDCNLEFNLPIDYVKSCPYLMSFMRNYKVKKEIIKYFNNNVNEVTKANKKDLWLKKTDIDKYTELPPTNARLELLKQYAFEGNSASYLWIPPSLPYYPLQGVYKNSKSFSKILVFSSWEMVPRMIGSLISYEAERKTIGKLYKQEKNIDRKNAHYFAESKKRYPSPRLRFSMSKGEVHNMSLFCLIYPSLVLQEIYDPIKYINNNSDLSKIEKDLKSDIRSHLKNLKKYIDTTSKRQDDRWYYLAPLLIDYEEYDLDEYFSSWYWGSVYGNAIDDEGEEKEDRSAYRNHFYKLKSYYDNIESLKLGKMPDDLVETLVNISLGSPAICISRTFNLPASKATNIARIMISNFNTTESTAIVELAYGKGKNDNFHWQNVLRYCKDGCLQAVFDEYYHMLNDSFSLASTSNKVNLIYEAMCNSLRIRSAAYNVDTFNAFKNRISGQKERGMSLRSSYATSFTKDTSETETNINRKENVRNAFNSPMRPFVLASTSIGQEGLDFHMYCRKVMHWNLPSNPIDIEQREGRVNRYKCLAIRQNVAQDYGDEHFQSDVWKEMFEAAEKGEKKGNQSELVPYWCFGENQSVKIERIVPMYPISKDEINYERMIKILSLYRLTLGQARQEELLEYLFDNFGNIEELKDLFINLSPITKEKDSE